MAARGSITTTLRELVREVDGVDLAVFDAIAHSNGRVLDQVMPRLTNAADHSKLWLGVAGVLALTGGQRGRDAASRGVMTLAVSSLLTNQVLKRVLPRRRPDRAHVPFTRGGRRHPGSSSFPSGHAASAAAFAAGAATEWPALEVPLAALAGAVGFSRVATGAHYPSDVIAGFIVGRSVASWGRRFVPTVEMPVQGTPGLGLIETGERPTGRGVVLVVNPASNSGRGESVIGEVRKHLPDAEIIRLEGDIDWNAVIDDAAARAEVLAVAGGDGTVGTAAQAALDRDVPLAVLPAGTFNHFAKDIGMFPLRAAIAAIRAGTAAKVDVGHVNDEIFLNTASVGAYTDFVRIREKYEHRIGKPAAAVLAGLRTIRRNHSLRIRADDAELDVSLMFIGNGQYLPQGFAPSVRVQLDDGIADLRTLKFTRGWNRWAVIYSLVSGGMTRSHHYNVTSASEVTIDLPDGPVPVARDGEVGDPADQLRVRIDRRALTVIRPRKRPR